MTTCIQQLRGERGAGLASDSGFRLDKVNQCAWLGAEQISLSPKAFAVLLHLCENAGRLVTKEELLDCVWPEVHVTEGVLKRAVLEIRKALSDSVEEPRFIQTLHRRGYRFLVQPAAEEAAEPIQPEQPVPGLLSLLQALLLAGRRHQSEPAPVAHHRWAIDARTASVQYRSYYRVRCAA